MTLKGLPGGLVVKILHFQCRGSGFDPWLGNWDPTCRAVQQNKRPLELQGHVTHAQPGDNASSGCGEPLPAVHQARSWGLLHPGPGPYSACCPVSEGKPSEMFISYTQEKVWPDRNHLNAKWKITRNRTFFNQRAARRSHQSVLKEVDPGYLLKDLMVQGFPSDPGEESTCSAGAAGAGFDPWIAKAPWGRAWQPPLRCSCLKNPMDRGA